MIKQFFSDEYIYDIETTELIDKLMEYFGDSNGIVFYKFPTIKEFDKSPISPDVFLVAESVGVLSLIVDTISVDRNSDYDKLEAKVSDIDNYIYTALLKNRKLQKNNRNLKFSVETVAYCPNFHGGSGSVYNSISSIVERIKAIESDNLLLDSDTISEIVASLEGSAAIIKPRERFISDDCNNTKAKILKDIETSIARFDDEQRFSALSLLKGPQRIRGLAGSGKTIILCLKAAHLHMLYPDAKVLYTFYTKSLYDYIVQLITRFYMKLADGQLPDFEKVQVLHAWGEKQVPGVYYEACRCNGIVPLTYNDAHGVANPFSYICKKFIEKTEYKANKMYDYVLIDEAQDFEAPFYQLCRSIVKDDHLVWCYDEVQNIFDVLIQNPQETFANEFDSEGIDLAKIQNDNPGIHNDIVLHKSYRNVRKILLVAVALGFGIYNDKLVQSLENNSHWEDLGFSVLSGDCSKEEEVVIERLKEASPLSLDESQLSDCISLYPADNFQEELKWIVNKITIAINEEGLLPEDIAVICIDQKNAMVYMEGLEKGLALAGIGTYNVLDRSYIKGFYRENRVTLSSVFKAKGNEAAMVFVCGCDAFEKRKDERRMRNMIFTSFTRAKVWLRITGTGKESLKQIYEEISRLEKNDYKFCFLNKPTHLLDKDWNEMNGYLRKEEEIRKSIEKEAGRLGISIDQYLNNLAKLEKDEEKRIDE